jgi:uncharacterized damage-inducible protein DinB
MLAHPHRVAQFNAWANQRMYAACATLEGAALKLDRGAFFGSIFGTLNHIVLVDKLYRERLEGTHPSRFGALDEHLSDNLADLAVMQTEMDTYYVDITRGLDAAALDEPVGFKTLLAEPEYWEVSRSIYFSNLFQHQVHHRGQAHNMLSQAGIDPPPMGFIEFEIELGDRISRRKA